MPPRGLAITNPQRCERKGQEGLAQRLCLPAPRELDLTRAQHGNMDSRDVFSVSLPRYLLHRVRDRGLTGHS